MNKKSQMQAQPGMSRGMPGMQPGAQTGAVGQPEKKKAPIWLWILLIIIVLGAIGTGAWFFMGK